MDWDVDVGGKEAGPGDATRLGVGRLSRFAGFGSSGSLFRIERRLDLLGGSGAGVAADAGAGAGVADGGSACAGGGSGADVGTEPGLEGSSFVGD